MISLTYGFAAEDPSAMRKTSLKSSSSSLTPGYKETMKDSMKEMLKEVAGEMVSGLMEAGPVRVAMLVSAVMFAQSSILDYVTFLSTAFNLIKSQFVLN